MSATQESYAKEARITMNAILYQLEHAGPVRRIDGRNVVLLPAWAVAAMESWIKDTLASEQK